jgi:hypothetical protein
LDRYAYVAGVICSDCITSAEELGRLVNNDVDEVGMFIDPKDSYDPYECEDGEPGRRDDSLWAILRSIQIRMATLRTDGEMESDEAKHLEELVRILAKTPGLL